MATTIRYLLPVINGYVSIPDGQILYPSTVTVQAAFTAIPGCKLVRVGPAGTEEVAGDYTVNDDSSLLAARVSLYLALPGWDAPGGPSVDYFKSLRDLAI